MSRVAILLLLFMVRAPGQSGHWRITYFHDEDKSSLSLADLRFASERRGFACGVLFEKGRTRPVVLSTADGGSQWTSMPVKELCRSLFFFNESLGWMVTEAGIWRTEEAGRDWKKVDNLRGVNRVHFLNAQHGFAAGLDKGVWETNDGGRQWKPVESAQSALGKSENSAWNWIEFANTSFGLIAGSSHAPRRDPPRFPEWMDPEVWNKRREWPALTLLMQTKDGGATWAASGSSLFGTIARVRLRPDLTGVALIEYREAFDFPSEVYELDFPHDKTASVYRRKDRAITDVALAGREVFLGGVDTAGKLRRTPVPGRVQILKSTDLNHWEVMPVDYRAVGTRVILSVIDSAHAWAATDTGMILRLDVTKQ